MNNKMEEPFNMNELTMCLHDSYQTMRDRIKKIELKVISNCLYYSSSGLFNKKIKSSKTKNNYYN